MARSGENIYKRKDGRWEGRYIIKSAKGSKYGYIYAKEYSEVKEQLKTLKIQSGLQAENIIPQKEEIFKNIAERWFSGKKLQIKESTAVKYRNILDSYLYPFIGDLTFPQLTHGSVEDLSKELLSHGSKTGEKLSPKTVSDVLSVLKNLVEYAGDQGIAIPTNACKIQIRQSSRRLFVFSKEEQSILCSYLLSSNAPRDLGILISLYTGLRIGEICALIWENINMKEHTIFVCQTMQRLQVQDDKNKKRTRISISSPKSACSIRTISLPDALYKRLTKFYKVKGYVLSGEETEFVEPRSMQNHFRYILKTCGIANTNYHTLRHTFATRCVELGFDVKTLSEILGHANVSITMNRYVHPSMELKREHMQRLSELIAVK